VQRRERRRGVSPTPAAIVSREYTDRNMGIRIMRGKAVRATIDEGFETSGLLQKERVHYLVRAL
jgi:hypothetical protein